MRIFHLILVLGLCLSACKPMPAEPLLPLMLYQQQQISLLISDKNIPVETPLTMTYRGPAVHSIEAELTGISMYMGRVPLRFVDTDNGEWQATFLLGACSVPKMEWQLTMTIQLSDGTQHQITEQFHSSW